MQTHAIDYKDRDKTFEGYVAYDESVNGRRPAVIVSHAWAGQTAFEQDKARQLAALGYVGFALDLYGKGIRGSNPPENARLMQPFLDDRAMLGRRMAAAVSEVKKLPQVDPARIAAIGYCFGGLCVLDLARSGTKDVRGVVSFHGLLGAPPKSAARIHASVLALHGYDDPMATPEQLVAFGSEMSRAEADWQVHAYGGTVHAFTNPEANMPESGIQYKAVADQRSWTAMRNFLLEVFK
jgi:dienelactone hydrolase